MRILASLPAVANSDPVWLKSIAFMVLSCYLITNSFFNVGICQYSSDPSESAVTRVLKVEFTIGRHFNVVTEFSFRHAYLSTNRSKLWEVVTFCDIIDKPVAISAADCDKLVIRIVSHDKSFRGKLFAGNLVQLIVIRIGMRSLFCDLYYSLWGGGAFSS